MQTLLAHSAFWRGVLLFAGMLYRKSAQGAKSGEIVCGTELVSWLPGAHSRREDELARSRLIGADTP